MHKLVLSYSMTALSMWYLPYLTWIIEVRIIEDVLNYKIYFLHLMECFDHNMQYNGFINITQKPLHSH